GDAAGQRAAMRAISRALPMLAPMRSLKIVRLPAGLDPDDLIKAQGSRAMEKLLAEPARLLDALWQAERDAQPLDSPESKAGLKKRLMDHVDTIADGDIKALYRRELLDRFSAFAYPPRPARPAMRGFQRGARTGFSNPVQSLSPTARATLQHVLSGSARAGLLHAVIAGLVKHPGEIERHAEALYRLARLDPKTTPLIESVIEFTETLDSRGQHAIFEAFGLPAPPDDLRYAFLREGTPPGEAREELAEAVTLLVQKPALEAALAGTISRFDEDPEGCFAEQARLRTQLASIEDRLKAFGRRKAAAGGADDHAKDDEDKAA
ncbi:MAG: DNA primase, partial [Pseudomonadota bacterium]